MIKPMYEPVNAQEFNAGIQGDNLTVVKFFATWCHPCKVYAPLIQQLSEEYPDVQFISVDIEKHPDIALENKVTSLPTIGLFKAGELVGYQIRAIREPALRKKIEESR